MKTRMSLAPLLALALAFSMVFVAAAPAHAACSPNGIVNSQGKCLQSYPSNWNWSYQYRERHYEFRDQTLLALIEHLQQMIRQLEAQLDEQDDDEYSEVNVVTRSAVNIDEDSATVRGRVYLGGADEATVYFEYGESRSNLDEETAPRTIEDGDVSYYFESKLSGLDDDTVYYFRAVAEDEDGDEDRGTIYSFRTSDGSDRDEPTLNTYDATGVEEYEADLNGYVNMNDFDNGRVFFVYGEDEDDVRDVADDHDRYVDIEERGDDLQKVLIDSDLDGATTYQENVDGLDADTEIFYSICVEYEDEDDEEVIVCGDVESFETDDD